VNWLVVATYTYTAFDVGLQHHSQKVSIGQWNLGEVERIVVNYLPMPLDALFEALPDRLISIIDNMVFCIIYKLDLQVRHCRVNLQGNVW